MVFKHIEHNSYDLYKDYRLTFTLKKKKKKINILARKTALSFLATAKVSFDGDKEMQHSCSHEPVGTSGSLSTASC